MAAGLLLSAGAGLAPSADARSWGSIPGGASSAQLTCPSSCTFAPVAYANQTLDEIAGDSGVITGWRLDGAAGKARLRVVGGPGATEWITLPAAGTHPAQLAVQPGQLVGVDLADGARVPFYDAGKDWTATR